MTDKPDLAIDQLLALRTSAGRLQERFSGVFSTETIERFLYHSYDEFASRAAVAQWLPLLAERFAVQRLTAWPGWRAAATTPADRAVPLRAQRRPLADGARILRASGR
jgi:hypothetical protein